MEALPDISSLKESGIGNIFRTLNRDATISVTVTSAVLVHLGFALLIQRRMTPEKRKMLNVRDYIVLVTLVRHWFLKMNKTIFWIAE